MGGGEKLNSLTNSKQSFQLTLTNGRMSTYIEPFVGGGAMLFYMLQTHSNIKSAIIKSDTSISKN